MKMFSMYLQIQNLSSKESDIRSTDLDTFPKKMMGRLEGSMSFREKVWERKESWGGQRAQGGKVASKMTA